MQLTTSITLLSALSVCTSALTPRQRAAADTIRSNLHLLERASPAAPNGYTPAEIACPSTRPSIRGAGQLSTQEQDWLSTRRPNTLQPMRELLTRVNIPGFDAGSYFDQHQNDISSLPNIGIAASGGGYRALMNGAGGIAAMDSRTPNSTSSGHIGGLLQSATYLAGLSGGSWLVGSLFVNNYTSVQEIIDAHSSLWDFTNSIIEGPDQSFQLLGTAEYYNTLVDDVHGKSDAGYNTSLTDYWGRALSFQLIDAPDGGPGYTFSSISNDSYFTQGNSPMPLLVTDGRAPGEVLISANSTVFEINPWEIGSWDPTVYAFAPLQYVGSRFDGGNLPDSNPCIGGFDNAGFVMGTSSSLFNQIVLQFNSTVTGIPDFLVSAIQDVLNSVGEADDDIADWTPNPFFNYKPDTNPSSGANLTLVDGGEDLQNIPLYPLIQPVRSVDVIFAIDSSADTDYSWPNGTALVATYERSLNTEIENGTAFPSIPGQNTFINRGLNMRPTFFGCDASNNTNAAQGLSNPGIAPLIVYLPNSPYVFNSNVSTFMLSYTNDDRNAIIENGYDVATQGNSTINSDWPVCVGCAIMQRAWLRNGDNIPDACNTCFTRYCWDGSLSEQAPAPYAPTPRLTPVGTGSVSGAGRVGMSAAAVMMASTVALWGLL